MSKPQIDIGLVIASFNDKEFLEPLFDSLYSKYAGCTFYPLVVNDHSTDGTDQWVTTHLKGYAAAITPVEKSFFTRANNTGLKWMADNVTPSVYMLLNSDTTVEDYWGAALMGTFLGHNAGVCGSTLLNPDGTLQHAGGFGWGQHYDINKPWMRHFEDWPVPWVTGACLAIRDSTLASVGFLKAGQRGVQYDGSDVNYCKRSRGLGYEVWMSANSIIYHYTHKAENYRRKKGHITAKEQEAVDMRRAHLKALEKQRSRGL